MITRPGTWDPGELAAVIGQLPPGVAAGGDDTVVQIPAIYDGPDLAEVAQLTGLSVSDVVDAHTGSEYTVGWLGFAPGFGYLTGLDSKAGGRAAAAEPAGQRSRRVCRDRGRAERRLSVGFAWRLAADRAHQGQDVGSGERASSPARARTPGPLRRPARRLVRAS